MTSLRMSLLVAVTLATAACSQSAKQSLPQQDSAQPLSLTSIFVEKDYSAKKLGAVRWMSDGQSYSALEDIAGQEKANQIILYQANSDARRVLVSSDMLTPAQASAPLYIDDYHWNSDQSQLLIYTNSKKVWRSNSRGDYWVLDMQSKKLTQLGAPTAASTQPSSMMFAKFSPDSRFVAFVRDNNLYAQSLTDYRITQLTFDGNRHIVNGVFDWVYEEEFGIADGFQWSPNGQHIAYWQLDTSRVRDFTMINNIDGLYPSLQTFPYPKAGEQNATVRIGVVDLRSTKTQWTTLPTDTDDFYIPRMNWAGSSEEILIQRVNRLQNQNDHYLVNITSGQVKNIYTDKDDAFFEWYYDVQWLNQGSAFLKISERDGWRHVYRISRDGKSIIDVTPGEFDIVDLVSVDEAAGYVYFTAGKDNVTETYLYRSNLNGSDEIERLTPAGYKGSNTYQISTNNQLAVHTFSDFRTPFQYRIISLPDHGEVRTLIDNAELAARFQQLQLGQLDFFQVPSFDGLMLDGYMIKPTNFDPNKTYPIIFYVYGEPWGQTVKNQWGSRGRQIWFEYLAQQGFIVASIDNRGTKSPRGRDWRKSIYRHIGTYASQDQAAALDAMAKRWQFIDTSRVGIWGHSGGGSMTLNMLFRFPEKYHAGIASAPVPSIRLYDTIYQERYMGLPDTYQMENGLDAYDQASPITFANQLQGKLLLIHGTGDDNVHYQGAELLINELVKHNKQFEFMAYPNRSHSLAEGEGTDIHRMTLMTDFFMENLQPQRY